MFLSYARTTSRWFGGMFPTAYIKTGYIKYHHIDWKVHSHVDKLPQLPDSVRPTLFIASKMLEIKSRHLTWVGPN